MQNEPFDQIQTRHVVVARDDHNKLKSRAALASRSLRDEYSYALTTLVRFTSTGRNSFVQRRELPRPIKDQTCRVNLQLHAETWEALHELRKRSGARNLDVVHAAVLMTD